MDNLYRLPNIESDCPKERKLARKFLEQQKEKREGRLPCGADEILTNGVGPRWEYARQDEANLVSDVIEKWPLTAPYREGDSKEEFKNRVFLWAWFVEAQKLKKEGTGCPFADKAFTEEFGPWEEITFCRPFGRVDRKPAHAQDRSQ